MEKIDVEQRAEKARQLFHEGYNCAQSVVLAYSDLFNLDPSLAASISAPLGGGMGRLREVCGAVSGMFMIAGLKYGPADPKDHAAKTAHYALVQQLAEKFKQENGSIICRELLGLTGPQGPEPDKRTAQYYQVRPCPEKVASAAGIVEELLKERS